MSAGIREFEKFQKKKPHAYFRAEMENDIWSVEMSVWNKEGYVNIFKAKKTKFDDAIIDAIHKAKEGEKNVH